MSPALPKIAPQLCRAVHEPPTGSVWLHEIKHDGHRIIATVDRDCQMTTNTLIICPKCKKQKAISFRQDEGQTR